MKLSDITLPSPMICFKVIVATSVIVFASWLAGKKPHLAGFITALPLVSLVAIAFSYMDHRDINITADYARSIIIAVPASWLFFIPFFFAEKWNLGFWISYGLGLILLTSGYFLHRYIMSKIGA